MAFTHIFDFPLLVSGFVTNILLMVAVARGTPATLKIDSEIAQLHLRIVWRFGLVESIILQSISFGYRNHILSHPSPRRRTVHLVVLLATLPNIAHLIAFKQAKVADPALLETLYDVYPQMNWTGAAYYGIPHLDDPYALSMFGVFFIVIPILFAYLIGATAEYANESVPTRKHERDLHRVLVKILTIHALLPMSMVIALICIGLLVMQIYSPELEAVAYLSAMIAPIFNPVVTIWFLSPYRTYVIRNLIGIKARAVSSVSQMDANSTSRTTEANR
uniref:G protein-coupled receptor n=1 Tax=Pristionchus pacificus TaxID=54126 RepID=A0A8R1UYC5_PRIPA